MAQAAATPNTRLSGTAMAAAISVSFMDEMASGSMMALMYMSNPLRKASANTAASGINRNKLRKAKAMPISDQRTQAGSDVARLRATLFL